MIASKQLLYTLHFCYTKYTCQQLGIEVESQGKANKSTTPRTALSFQGKKRAVLGGIRTHDTLQSRRALHQLSYHTMYKLQQEAVKLYYQTHCA